MTHRPRKAQTMRDRDRKREADRERRARIKAGTWDFPNGGAAEFAKAGAVVHPISKPLDRSPKSLDLPAKPEAFMPAPAPRPVSSAPARTISHSPIDHVITPPGAGRSFAGARSRPFDKLRTPAVNGRDWRSARSWPCSPRLRLSCATGHRRCLDVHEMAREH
jgi:hypothetical protein